MHSSTCIRGESVDNRPYYRSRISVFRHPRRVEFRGGILWNETRPFSRSQNEAVRRADDFFEIRLDRVHGLLGICRDVAHGDEHRI